MNLRVRSVAALVVIAALVTPPPKHRARGPFEVVVDIVLLWLR